MSNYLCKFATAFLYEYVMNWHRTGRWFALAMILTVSLSAWARNERDTLGAGTLVSFTENLGQWNQKVRYAVQLKDAAVFLESDGLTVALREHREHPGGSEKWKVESGKLRCHAYKMTFAGASPTLPTGYERRDGYSNYFIGDDPSRWRSRVGSYVAVRYEELYPGVAFEIYGGQRALKYNFIVEPGADASQIVIEYEGVDGVSVGSSGALFVQTSLRNVIESKPYVYQTYGAGDMVKIESRWRVEKIKGEKWRVTIELGEYNHNRKLVIDPVLIFSTYTGSTADNWGTTAAYDSEKNVYTAGLVFGVGYPVSLGAYMEESGGCADVGIFKFNALGDSCLYATYLGGGSTDMPHSLFVNSFDELIVFGTTGSTDFPTTEGAYQQRHQGGDSLSYENTSQLAFPTGSDIFVSRLSADGSQLQASTYVGGSGNDGLNYRQHFNNNYNIIMGGNDSLYYNYGDGARGEIITDDLNNVYVGSTTMSSNFPTTAGSLQPTHRGRQDGVVFKLDHNLRTLLWSTYLGGYQDDAVYSIDVDSAYNLLVCGGTNSSNFPTTENAWQPTYGGGPADGFVSKISYNGDRLMASTFVGARFYDQLYFVRSGKHDEVFLFGQTKPMGTSIFIYNAGYSVYNSGMLLMRMKPDLDNRVWSTLFGTPGRINLSPTAFAADICNRIYAVGWGRDFVPYIASWHTAGTTGMETTLGSTPPSTPNIYYSDTTDGQDFYIMSIDADANNLDYATFFGELHEEGDTYRGGADHVDGGTSRFDRLATLYQSVCGSCGGTQGFPTTANAWSDSNRASNCNNALFRFNVTDDFPVAEFILPTTGCAPYNVTFRNTGRGTSFEWHFGDGATSTERNPSHTYSAGGLYTVTLIARMPGGCSEADTQRHTLHVIGDGGYSFEPLIACSGAQIQIGLQPRLGATYQWISGEVSDPTVANPWVNEAGTYMLKVSAPGCYEVDTFEVQTYTLVDLWQTTAISCHDSADGSVFFRLGPGIEADSTQFNLTRGGTQYTPSQQGNTFTFTGLAAGTYRATATGYGCEWEQDFTLDNPATPAYEKTVSPMLCDDSCKGWINIRYDLSAIPEISPRDTLIQGLCEGTYITTLTSLGCPLTDTTVIGRNHELDSLNAWADKYTAYVGEPVGLHADVGQAADSITFLWTPATDIDRPDAQNPTATPSDTAVCYTVTATTATGCTATDTVCLKCTDIICGAPDYVIPNAFTPNGDGVNDVVDFSSPLLTEIHIAVFNRWGECVYESRDLTNCRWDGTYRNERCLPGVYTYTCTIRCHNQVETELKGDITIIL